MPRALVIDDSRAMRSILARILADCGFDAIQAANGKEALVAMEREGASLDLILVDWNMPEMSGLEFLAELRSRPAFARLPVIMVTTETEVEQMQRALAAGADEYVMKPFTRDAIEDKLRMVGAIQ